MTRRRQQQTGLGLVEFLVASGIVAVGSFMLLGFLLNQVDFLETSGASTEVRSWAQLAVNTVGQEVRHATRTGAGSPPNISIPAAPNNTSVTLYVATDQDGNGTITDAAGNIEWDGANPIQYLYVPAGRQLVRIEGGLTRVVANNVTDARFEDQTMDVSLKDDELKMRLTLERTTLHQRTVSATTTTIIKLRN